MNVRRDADERVADERVLRVNDRLEQQSSFASTQQAQAEQPRESDVRRKEKHMKLEKKRPSSSSSSQ